MVGQIKFLRSIPVPLCEQYRQLLSCTPKAIKVLLSSTFSREVETAVKRSSVAIWHGVS